MMRLRDLWTGSDDVPALVAHVQARALPLKSADHLDPLLERIGDARLVLLGEASHGTSEYYTWRARITQRLIREKGFSFIAVEGDWPDCYQVNRYVKGCPNSGESARAVLHAFDRWPTWMWANQEIVELAEWLRDHNDDLPEERRVGFYGLDVYSLWDSMRAVIGYLEPLDGDAAQAARRAYACFDPYGEDVQEYALATRWVPAPCEQEVSRLLTELRRKAPEYQDGSREAFFNAEQNALVARHAEQYYRAMVRGGAASWNVRDEHMMETLERLLAHHGPQAKAVVWEHNTHVGDARATDMAAEGMVNLGQLARERREADGVVLVGFGSYQGRVIAGSAWEAPMQRLPVPPARPGSWEAVLHQAGASDKLLLLDPERDPAPFLAPRGHRAIGVVYRPEFESRGNYVPTVLPRRYDAFLYLDETHALRPLHLAPAAEHAGEEAPETFPSGV
jgi:erythromycin esterase